MATISGKRFQITDGAASPTNLFPYTVTEAVYGLSSVINTAKSDVTSALTAVTLNGTSKAGTTASFYAPTTAGTTGQILKATTSGAPVWTTSALGTSNKPIYLNSSGVLTEGVSCLPLTAGSSYPLTGNLYIATTSEPAIVFKEGGTDVGHVDASSTLGVRLYHPGSGYPSIAIKPGVAYPVFRYNSTDYTVYHSGNFVAGTNYVSISGTETITGAKTFSNTVKLTYGTNLIFVGASSESHSVRVFVNYPNDLSHHDGSSWRRIWDSGNSNKSDVAWACSTLTASGNATIAGNVGIGTASSGYKLDVNGTARFGSLTPADGIYVIPFAVANAGYSNSGWCASIGTGSGGVLLGYRSNVSAAVIGSSNATNIAIAPDGGNVGIGTTTPTQKLHVDGALLSTGDQVVSSDLTLKTNLTPVTYSVSDIAKSRAVEFDWKDGRGHSMGSIAQDWLKIAPSLVHGEEGSMSLAYGQLALVNTILLARQSESHEERIKELEARVAELESENQRLRMN